MPRNDVVARRYASALFHMENGNTDHRPKILEELKAFDQILENQKSIKQFLLSPIIPRDEKKSALTDIKEKLPLTYRFLAALVDADRMENFGEIVAEFEKALEESSGQLSVQLELAAKIPDSQVEEIRSYLQDQWKKKIRLNTSVNEKLIGGFVAKAPGKILDASVASQLEQLRQRVLA